MISSRVLPAFRSAVVGRAFGSFVGRASGSLSRRAFVGPRVAIAFPQQQVRQIQVNVTGPFDPPKQLTFKEVEDRVLKAIRAWDRFPAEKSSQLTLDVAFTDLGFDSLDKVEIVMALEDEFNFEIPDADADKLKTPRDVFKYVCEREDVYE